jgi:hypothetical protein
MAIFLSVVEDADDVEGFCVRVNPVEKKKPGCSRCFVQGGLLVRLPLGVHGLGDVPGPSRFDFQGVPGGEHPSFLLIASFGLGDEYSADKTAAAMPA